MRTCGLLLAAAALFACGTAYAQRAEIAPYGRVETVESLKSSGILDDMRATRPYNFRGDEISRRSMPAPYLESKRSFSFLGLGPGDSIGYTYYDLQTNGAMTDRIINWGTLSGATGYEASMVWTASTDVPPPTGDYEAPSRGTYGAVYVDGSWAPLPDFQTWQRLEDMRTGFVEADHLADGRMIFVNHSAEGVRIYIESSPGSRTFGSTQIPGSEAGLWASVAVGGSGNSQVIHVIWTYTTDHAREDQIYYSRSMDEGNEWTAPVPLSGPTSITGDTLPNGFGANAYAIAANRGEDVVVWYLTSSIRMIQMKSFDAGGTWPLEDAVVPVGPNNRRVYTQHSNPDSVYWTTQDGDTLRYRTDTVFAPGSGLDVMIDDNGIVHGICSIYPSYITRHHANGADSTSTTFRNGTIYQATFAYPDAGLLYCRVEGTSLRRGFIAQPGGLNNVDNPDDYQNFFFRRAYNGGFSLYPQLGTDADGNIYAVFTSGVANDTTIRKRRDTSTTMESFLYGHIYATWTQNGTDWMIPKDLTPTTRIDNKYGTLANNVTDKLYIGYQADLYPGEMVPDTLAALPRERNAIQAMIIAQSSLDGPFGDVEDDNSNATTGRSLIASATPNPSKGMTQVAYTVAKSGSVTMKLVNTLGQEVLSLVDGRMLAGGYSANFDASTLPAGTYYIVLTNGGQISTKMINVMP